MGEVYIFSFEEEKHFFKKATRWHTAAFQLKLSPSSSFGF
jgi:hypothetical protein